MLGHPKCIIDLEPETAHRTLQLAAARQQLHRAEILRSSIDQRSLGSSHRMCSVGGNIQADIDGPSIDAPRVLLR